MAQNLVQNQFCSYFFKFTSLVFLDITQDDSLEHCLNKTLEKNFWGPKLDSKLGQGFCHFCKVPLVFPDIAQDCSLGQFLTASRTETSKKDFFWPKLTEMIYSILMLLSVLSNLLQFNIHNANFLQSLLNYYYYLYFPLVIVIFVIIIVNFLL